jgi:hypothetical protein
MANIKISALTTYTGNPSDNRWFIMNNSANTETFKYSGYSSPLRYGTPDNSIISPYLSPSSVGGIYDLNIQGTGNTISSTGGLNQIIGGGNNNITGDQRRQSIINSQNCDISSTRSPADDVGGFNGIYNSYNSTMSNVCWFDTILGAYDGDMNGVVWCTIINGDGNKINGGTGSLNFQNSYSTIIGGSSNQLNSSGGGAGSNNGIFSSGQGSIDNSETCVIIGGFQSSISSSSYSATLGRNNDISSSNYVVSLGGHNHVINGSSESGIFAGYSSSITNANDSGIYAGRSNTINGGGCCGGNVIVGGENNSISNSPGKNNAIIQGYLNDIRTSADYATIINGQSNQISSSETNNVIIAGNNNTITGTTSGSTMIGTKTRTPIVNDTVHVENLRAYGQSYDGYFNNGSGSTFTIDWNKGNTQKMNLTGAGGITCSNTETGATYRMIINNPSGFTPTSFTASGRAIKFNGGSFVAYSGESICQLFITDDSVYVSQLGLFS